MNRYLLPAIRDLMGKKMILLMGPRQVGKTTLSKAASPSFAYYNYDIKKDLQVFKNLEWDRSKSLVIFDELHKMKKWKLWLKGIYDAGETQHQNFLITGSARLDIAKRMGDSLAGRFFSLRLNPLDLKELKSHENLESNYRRLLNVGGFPEPFFEGNQKFYGLWSKSHLDVIIKQDLVTLENVRDIDGIETLIELLRTRVGSLISYNSLSEDLGRDDKTVKRWLGLLEQMYIVFRVSPYHRNIARGIKKAGKYYFYDIGGVTGDEEQKLENLVALSLKKEIEFQEDTAGVRGELQFIQTKDKREIDFLVSQKQRPTRLIEVKLSDGQPSKNFSLFDKVLPSAEKIQLVRHLDREFQSAKGVQIRSALDYLEKLDLS